MPVGEIKMPVDEIKIPVSTKDLCVDFNQNTFLFL